MLEHVRGPLRSLACPAAIAALAVALPAAVVPAHARALGPYPDLGGCQVFPDPPPSLSPSTPSLPDEAAWNQDISHAPVAANSAATIAYVDSHGGGFLHPDFGSPRAYGFPYAVVGGGQPDAQRRPRPRLLRLSRPRTRRDGNRHAGGTPTPPRHPRRPPPRRR